MTFLSLAGSQLKHLNAAGMRVAGSVDLSSLSSVDPHGSASGADGGLCWVEMRDVAIDGNLLAPDAYLVAPPRRSDFLPGKVRAQYALDLRSANIAGELILWPNFVAYGGVNIRSAHVGHDVIMSGAALTAVEWHALTAAGAHIGGAALLNAASTTEGVKPFNARGEVSFLDARVAGSIEVRGASIQSFSAINAQIGGSAMLGAWHSEHGILKFVSDQDVSLSAVRIAGTLDMSGAQAKVISAQNARIGGAALLRAFDGHSTTVACSVDSQIILAGARISGDLDLSGASFKNLDAQNAEIGGSVYLICWHGRNNVFRLNALGTVSFAGTKIVGNINMNGASVGALSADNADIGGAAFLGTWSVQGTVLPFEASGEVSLMGTRIAGNLEMAGASIRDLFAVKAQIGGGRFFEHGMD